MQTHHDLGHSVGSKPLPKALWTNLKLCTLNLSFEWNHQTRDGNPHFQLGQMAILDASELQHLSVNIQYPGKGNHREDLFRSGNNLGAFKFTINRILPPIRTLELHGYSVGLGLQDELEHRLQVSSLRDLTLNPGPHSDLYLFLETLMKGGNLCFKMLDIYKRALCGSLIHSESRVILRRFLRSFQGLKEFVMRGHNTLPYRSVVDAITWLGDTLETLVLYDPDGTPPTLQRFAQPLRVTAEIVQILYVTCTSLRTLTLYLHFGTVSRLHAIEFGHPG